MLKDKSIRTYNGIVKSYWKAQDNDPLSLNTQSIRFSTDLQKVKPLLTWRLMNLNLK